VRLFSKKKKGRSAVRTYTFTTNVPTEGAKADCSFLPREGVWWVAVLRCESRGSCCRCPFLQASGGQSCLVAWRLFIRGL